MSFHKNHWLLFSVIFFGYIALSWIAGIGPAIWVQNHARALPGAEPMTEIERRGLQVYVAEGCIACHTQQVRPLKMDAVWGRPSAPADYAHVKPLDLWRPYAPAVLGSERTGPDLTSIGTRQPSETWQYLHLYNPRAVSPDSIMPAHPWLFEVVATPAADAVVVPLPPSHAPRSGTVVATARAKALVAYLLSLKQVPLQASGTPAQPDQAAAAGTDGATLYSNHCAACHQANGQGLAGVFPSLVNDPAVIAGDPTRHIATILHGAQGRVIGGVTYPAPMPGFADQLTDAQIAAIIAHERTSWGNQAPTVTEKDVAAVRKRGGT